MASTCPTNRILLPLAGLLISAAGLFAAEGPVIRAGIVGCDTSHVIAFTDLINDPDATGALAKVKITVAYPGGSDDLSASRDRIAGFVAGLRDRGIEIVETMEEVAEQTDAVLLESVDGRVHLAQFRQLARGKPVFIDKPAAASLADVLAIFRHADATGTPCFTTSGLRYGEEITTLADDRSLGEMLGCETAGPLRIEPTHPDLFWYGIHGVESLFALMGVGCKTVTRIESDLSSLVVGRWHDGRLGSYRGQRQGRSNYSATVYGTSGVGHRTGFSGYGPLVHEICEFFLTGREPVSRDETIEIFAFMEAADESKRLGGQPVLIEDVIQRARRQLDQESDNCDHPVSGKSNHELQ